MATSTKTPYEILGVSENTRGYDLRVIYRTKIHEHLQNKISPIDFRLICRAQETLSDYNKRKQYDSLKKWIFDIPIDRYTSQQLAAEPHLISDLKKRLEHVTLTEINAEDPITRQTALYCAARAGNVEAVKFLTEHGAEPDLSQRTNSTALHVASFYGHANVVRCLLESGADYRSKNSNNRTAEEEAYGDDVKQVFAELKRNPYVRAAANELRWFRENGLTQHQDTEYFAQRQTLLHCVSKKGYFNMVRLLVEERSANVDLVDINGNSPLHLAVYGGHLDIIEYLLNRGCDPSFRNRWGTTAEEVGSNDNRWIADIFKSMRERDMFEMARQGVDWWFYYYFNDKSKDMIDSNGISLLYYACRYGKYSVAKWLLEHGANMNIQITTQRKNTSLHVAKYYGHVSIVELLLEYDADVNINNGFGATIFDQEISSEVNDYSASKITELLQQYKGGLKTVKVLDIYVYEDDDNTQQPIAKIKFGMNADYHNLLAALSGTPGNRYPYFSVARRALEFSKEDPSIISAVCRARYTSSKFIDTPICLIRHKTEPKKTEKQKLTFRDSKLFIQQLSRHGKVTSFSLQAPLIEEKSINVGNLIFTFSESSVNEDIEFEVTTLFPSDPGSFSLSGCICLFKTEIYSDISNLIELPVVSLINEPHACLYSLATPTSCWFTSTTHRTRLPIIGGIHALIRHVEIIRNHLTLPADMFIAAALGQPLTERNDPVPCTCLLLRERNVDKFPLIAYHGTNIENIQSILLDGLVVPGTVVSSGKRIQLPDSHIPQNRLFSVHDFSAAIFLSPSIHYTSDPVFAVTFSDGDRQLRPVLECSVKRGSYDTYPCTVQGYTARPGEDMKAIDWRVEDPANIEINAVLFIR